MAGVSGVVRWLPAGTPRLRSATRAGSVIGAPGTAETPALRISRLRAAASTRAMAAAIGERQVLPPQTKRKSRIGPAPAPAPAPPSPPAAAAAAAAERLAIHAGLASSRMATRTSARPRYCAPLGGATP